MGCAALVLGGASCVWGDAERALQLFEPDTFIAVNNMIVDWPGRLDLAVTLHPEKTKDWPGIVEALRRRKLIGRIGPRETWGHRPTKGIDRDTKDWAGSSGLFAVKVALETGHDRVVLAGVPMLAKEEHYFSRGEWQAAHSFLNGWRRHEKHFAPFVRSMSGWTRDRHGEPDIEWLTGGA
jgi:hypothetical protein